MNNQHQLLSAGTTVVFTYYPDYLLSKGYKTHDMKRIYCIGNYVIQTIYIKTTSTTVH